jgi:hypothetical protein
MSNLTVLKIDIKDSNRAFYLDTILVRILRDVRDVEAWKVEAGG